MGTITSLAQIGLSALQAAQTGLSTTGNNIANANSPGYSVESTIQSPQVPQGQAGVIEGSGVQVDSIARSFSNFAEKQLWQATASSNAADQLNTLMGQLNDALSSSAANLTPALSGFFQSVQNLANNPAGATERQGFLSSSGTLANRFNALGSALQQQSSNIHTQISSTVGQINTLTHQVAQLNQQIGALEQGSTASQPNGLLDQRDHLVTQLNKLVGVSVLKQNGNYNIYTANGQVLVNGTKAFTLGTQADSLNPQALDVVYTPSGAVISNGITGGALGGLYSGEKTVTQAQNKLGRIAAAISANVNRQQSLGIDLNGNLGQPVFSTPVPQVSAATTNTGSAQLTATITNTKQLTASNYELSYQNGAWHVETYPSGQSVASTVSGSTISFGGLAVKVNGTPSNGDRFLVRPTGNMATGIQVALTDPKGIAAAAPYVASAGQLSGGSLSDTNTGNVQISSGQAVTSAASGAVTLPSSDFGKTLSIQFLSPTQYQVSDANGVVASGSYSPSSGGTLDIAYPTPPAPSGMYWQVSMTGSNPQAGDSYVLQPSGPGDNRNALGFSKLQLAKTIGNGTSDFSGAYASLTGEVGNAGQQAQLASQAQQATLQSAQQTQQSISGVNLNGEAANLLKYQQAFQAAAKSISVANQMFQTILSI